jgi:sucrose-6-phosphate hydrolase SacC (GH32 family)
LIWKACPRTFVRSRPLTSRDLIHWTELQPAIWEDERFGTGVQSGGAVLDQANSSGLAPVGSPPPLVAFWAGNDNRSQCISYSLNRGRNWTKYARNPVLVDPERDPKVFWHQPTHRWIMVLYGSGSYFLFTSRNLLDWTVKTVEILVDRTSIETFVNEGEVSLSACFLPAGDRLELANDRGPARIRSLRVFEIKSMWGRN